MEERKGRDKEGRKGGRRRALNDHQGFFRGAPQNILAFQTKKYFIYNSTEMMHVTLSPPGNCTEALPPSSSTPLPPLKKQKTPELDKPIV